MTLVTVVFLLTALIQSQANHLKPQAIRSKVAELNGSFWQVLPLLSWGVRTWSWLTRSGVTKQFGFKVKALGLKPFGSMKRTIWIHLIILLPNDLPQKQKTSKDSKVVERILSCPHSTYSSQPFSGDYDTAQCAHSSFGFRGPVLTQWSPVTTPWCVRRESLTAT